MKIKILFLSVFIIALAIAGCKEETPIGDPIEIDPGYDLSRLGNAPEAVNDRIRALYDKYGSFFIYDFDEKDALWAQVSGAGVVNKYAATLGDPKYVDAMLDLLYDTWMQFFPEELLKAKGGIPYRVFLADQTYRDRSDVTPGWYIQYTYYPNPLPANSNTVIFAGMNESLETMTGAQRTAKKTEWVKVMYDYYVNSKIIVEPEPTGFWEFTDYVTAPAWMLDGYWNYAYATTPESVELARRAGFLPSNPSTTANWVTSAYNWTNAKTNDFGYFKTWLWQATDAQIEPYLTNPDYTIIQQKWAWMVDYYKNVVGIDVRKIANTSF